MLQRFCFFVFLVGWGLVFMLVVVVAFVLKHASLHGIEK